MAGIGGASRLNTAVLRRRDGGAMKPLEAGDPASVGDGRYRLVGRLGRGGMGVVYFGRSRSGRAVAVKVVRPELSTEPGFRRRFADEVAAARRVGGFHTAPVVDADPEGDPAWLVTAYVPGPTLQAVLERVGSLPADTLTVLAAGLAEALAAIHQAGVIHRDLKPANIIVAEDGPGSSTSASRGPSTVRRSRRPGSRSAPSAPSRRSS